MEVVIMENSERINIRKQIKENGFDFYIRLSKKSKTLQYIAGEFMSLNEEYVLNNPRLIGAHTILMTGFTENQKILLLELEKEL